MIFYRKDGTKVLDVQVDDNSYRFREIMGDNTLTLYFSLAEHVEIPLGAYVDYQGERYTLDRPEALTMHHTRYFEYTVTLESIQAKAKIWKFRCLYANEKQTLTDGRLKFSLTAKPKEHLQMFVDNMNRRDSGWTIGECIDGTEKCINYDHAFCWAALGQMADEFETEFEIIGKRVSLHKVEHNKKTPLPLSYGKGNGFKSGVGRSNYEDNPPIEILYTQGGESNIDYSKYGSSELHLPKNGTIAYDGEFFEDEEGFDASLAHTYIADDKGLSVYRLDGTRSSLAEDSLDCSDIYPKRVGAILEVVCVDKDNNFYDIIDSSIPDTLNFEDCLIEGETMTVIFQSGMLAGKEFEVKYYHTPKNNKKGRRFEIVPQEVDGQTMPNETFKPTAKDTYAVFNCFLPQAYINAYEKQGDPKTGAEWDMMRQAVKYLYDNEQQNFSFTGTLDGIYAKKNWLNIGAKICLGGFVLFTDDRFQKEGVRIRIISIKDYINTPYSPEIELSNSTVTGSFTNTLQQITSSEVIAEEQHKEAIQFTKRRFRDAKETLSMIEEALLDNFTNSITPITVQTMAMLVGDESLQFRFVNSMTTPQPVECAISYDATTKQLHCPSGIIQHMTLGIDAVSPDHKASEYRFWSIEEYTSGRLDDTDAKYYLYAKVRKDTDKPIGTYYLSATARKMDSIADTENYYLLIGILNSEYDGERSFASLYGFTEILPGRITTDRIVSSEGQSFFDLVGNAMKLGDALDFNTAGDGKLRLKGTIVQSQSGDSNYIGCYRGIYNPNLTYFQGDEVSYEIEKCTSTYRYIHATPASGILPTDTDHWQVVAQGSEGKQGKDGISPNTAFKSTIFRRTNAMPSLPIGGSYASPVPSGWSDGIPSGEAKLWASTRIFSSDGKAPQQGAWTTPRQMTDTADFDVEYSSESNPDAPTGHPNTNTQWSNESSEDTVWMATSRKSNGVWEEWQISRIKGENGQDGTSVKIIGQSVGTYDTVTDAKAAVPKGGFALAYLNEDETEESNKYVWYVYKNPRLLIGVGYRITVHKANINDAFIDYNTGHLIIATEDTWQDVGQIKGDKGDTGADGKNAYVHIKYAKSLTENDWSENDGETPSEYIGVYADNNPTDQLVWSLYSWTKWKGEDGFGYEYIYKRTSSATAPATPTETSQSDGFVPTGWTDDPTGVDASNMYEWVCYRKKTLGTWGVFIGSASDNSKAAMWAKYGQTGSTGAKGDYTEIRYAKNGSPTTAPNIAQGLTSPTGWSVNLPSVGVAEYLWMTSAQKTGTGALKTLWSSPVRVSGINGTNGSDGKDGKSPAMVFRGDYNASNEYYGNEYRLDCVRVGSAYYIARIDAGTFKGIAPPDTTKWNAFGASFDSVATQLLLAEGANIAGWIFRDGKLWAQNGEFYLNGANGEFGGIIKSALFYGSSKEIPLSTTLNTTYYIKPNEDFASLYIINEPSKKTFIVLPKASDWDGLELSFFIKQSSWRYDVNTSHIKPQDGDRMFIKTNIYNLWSDDKSYHTLEDFNTQYKESQNSYWMMQPNMMIQFKSILGAWYCIKGVWTGE